MIKVIHCKKSICCVTFVYNTQIVKLLASLTPVYLTMQVWFVHCKLAKSQYTVSTYNLTIVDRLTSFFSHSPGRGHTFLYFIEVQALYLEVTVWPPEVAKDGAVSSNPELAEFYSENYWPYALEAHIKCPKLSCNGRFDFFQCNFSPVAVVCKQLV